MNTLIFYFIVKSTLRHIYDILVLRGAEEVEQYLLASIKLTL